MAGKSGRDEEATQEPGKAKLPLFYTAPRPLDAERHAGKSIKSKTSYSFASETNAVPLTVAEFPRAMRHYPIVFASDSPAMPLAVLGLRNAENVFVGEDGSWQPGCYIPAYIRRVPFIFLESADKLNFTLCVDEASEFLVEESDAQPLFTDGKPSEVTDNALKFCSAYQGQSTATRELVAALDEHDLLVPNQAGVTLASGEKMSLSGFRVIDEKKLTALPGEKFLDWRERGWLAPIYAQMLSSAAWQTLIDLAAQRAKA